MTPFPPGIYDVICPICQNVIAKVDTATLFLPLVGSQFVSPDPGHGFPAPFHEDADWLNMWCPYGGIRGHRGVIDASTIMLSTGMMLRASYDVPESPIQEVTQDAEEEEIEQEAEAGQEHKEEVRPRILMTEIGKRSYHKSGMANHKSKRRHAR
jgi:hypothetical protein